MDEIQANFNDNTVTFAAPPATGKVGRTLKPGDIVGDNYRLQDLLGKGGMGVVYRCEHIVFGREYALKILAPDQVSEVSWQRFQLEGQAIARLEHVSIVKIYNMGIDKKDCPYYVMELLEGWSLDDLIDENGPLTVQAALPIFYQVAEALAYAHMKGVIHRDIKPSNIVLHDGPDGSVKIKIVDFGLAKVVKKDSFEKQSLTSAGEIFGTPSFMSPEQSLGQDVDGRSDVYSLGCTMFKALTGSAPFRGANAFETMLLHQTQPAPFLCQAARDKQFSEPLEELMRKMLEKNPDKRHQSMQQVCHDLDRVAEGKNLSKAALGIKEVAIPTPGNLVRASKRGLLLITLLSLASVCVGYFVITFINKKQTYQPGDAGVKRAIATPAKTFATALPVSSDMFAAQKGHEHDENMDVAIAAFKKFESKKTRHFVEKGTRKLTMYFPTVSVAEVDIPNTQYKELARNAVTLLDMNCALRLTIRGSTNRFTCANPWVLEKLDPEGITDVNLLQENFSVLGDEGSGIEELNEKRIIDLLKAMHNWHDLKGLSFSQFTITSAIFDELDKMQHIEGLAVQDSETQGEVFAGRKMLKKLKTICLRSQIDIDGAIRNLPPSETLETIVLDRTIPSPESLRRLKAFPNLKNFCLEWTSISDEQIDAIAELKGLRELHVEHCILNKKRAERLVNFNYLKVLVISNPGWTPEYREQVKSLHPYAFIFDHKVRNLDLETEQKVKNFDLETKEKP